MKTLYNKLTNTLKTGFRRFWGTGWTISGIFSLKSFWDLGEATIKISAQSIGGVKVQTYHISLEEEWTFHG